MNVEIILNGIVMRKLRTNNQMKHKHKWVSMAPDYNGFMCKCEAWSPSSNPKEEEICYEGSVLNRNQSLSDNEVNKLIKEKGNQHFEY